MKTRQVDTIYRVKIEKPAEIEPRPSKSFVPERPKRRLWPWILGGFF